MSTVRTAFEGETFNHRILWFIVSRQLKHANENAAGAMHDHLVAMVFAFHALEAYLNFIGERLAPDVWADERRYFGRSDYQGFAGKLKKVLELVGMAAPEKTTRPYSTVWLLKNLRDQIAHARTERYTFAVDHPPDENLTLHLKLFGGLVTKENAEMAHADIEAFADQIHDLARPKLTAIVGDRAFRGMLSFGTHHGTVAA